MRKLTILILFVVLSFTMLFCPVAAQDNISEIEIVINMAEGLLYSFQVKLHEYWLNVNETVRHQSFNDSYQSRLDLDFAKVTFEQENYDRAVESAYRPWFLARRAIFRLYVCMAWKKIQLANKTIMDIPSYIAETSIVTNVPPAIRTIPHREYCPVGE